MKIGFGRADITPRVGVQLCGFGPFINRYSVGVRDRLWARAMAVEAAGRRLVLVSCDLPGTTLSITSRVRELVRAETGLNADAVLVHSTHTHSGPNTMDLIGWGEADAPYLELLPRRIAQACACAIQALREATLSHAEVPCEGIGQNREYDRDGLPFNEVMTPGWRPRKPELTDTTCHVLKATAEGRIIGFVSYFGCHPVVCCEQTRHFHGDYCGVATNLLEQEFPGSVGLFLQGAVGDVNPRFVHKPEAESLQALDTIGAEYATFVREGLNQSNPISVESVASIRRFVEFSRKPWDLPKLKAMLAEKESMLAAATDDSDYKFRINTVETFALRRLIAKAQSGARLAEPVELHGIRIGPLALLGSPFEVFQAIKRDVLRASRATIPLVLSFANSTAGYATDSTVAARGGYAQDFAPMIFAQLPYANIHDELVSGLLALDKEIFA